MTMYPFVDDLPGDSAVLSVEGADELRQWEPVYPGDTLVVENEVLETTAETDSRGLVEIRTTTRVERELGEVGKVCSFVSHVVLIHRDDDAE